MNKSDVNIFDVANFFLKIVDRDSGSTITPLKMQKVLYYAQGYYLAKNKQALFPEDFEAWAHGPVNPKVYDAYKKYGYNIIDYVPEELYDFKQDDVLFLTKIWNTFGIYDGKYLEELIRSEKPWISARKGLEPGQRSGNIITKEIMQNFFSTDPYNVF